MALFYCFLFFISACYAIDSSIYETPSLDHVSSSAIVQIESLEEISKQLEKLGDDSLLVLDVDEVLITSKDDFFQPVAEPYVLGLVKGAMENAKTAEERKRMEKNLASSLVKTERVLVEQISLKLLDELYRKGVKVVALTSFPTGRFGSISQCEKWRVNQLKSFGFHFDRFFPQFCRYEFLGVARPSMAAPLFQDGILFSRGYSKGDVLLAFLDILHWNPSKVVFVDDILENHEKMALSLAGRGIGFQGFLYRPKTYVTEVDRKAIEFQFRSLIKNGNLK